MSSTAIGSLSVQLTAGTGGLGPSLQRAGGMFSGFASLASGRMAQVGTGVGQMVQGLSSGSIAGALTGLASGLGMALGGPAAGAAAGALVGALATPLDFGIRLAGQAEQALVAFEVMLGSAGKARTLFDEITKFAVQTPYESPELIAATKQLLAMGVGAQSVMNDMRMLGDVASLVAKDGNLKQSLLDLAFLFGKINSEGRVTGIHLMQLDKRGVGFTTALAGVLGTDEAGARAAVKARTVTLAHARQAFAALTGEGGRFYQAMDKQSKTLLGLWSSFTDLVGLSLRDVAETLLGAFNVKGGLKGFIDGLTGLRDNPGFKEWLAIASAGLTALGGVIQANWNAFIQPMIDGLGSLLGMFAGDMTFKDFMTGLVTGLAVVEFTLNNLGSLFHAVFLEAGLLGVRFFNTLVEWGGKAWAALMGGLEVFGQKVADVLGWVVEKLKPVASALAKVANKASNLVGKGDVFNVDEILGAGTDFKFNMPGKKMPGLDGFQGFMAEVEGALDELAFAAWAGLEGDFLALMEKRLGPLLNPPAGPAKEALGGGDKKDAGAAGAAFKLSEAFTHGSSQAMEAIAAFRAQGAGADPLARQEELAKKRVAQGEEQIDWLRQIAEFLGGLEPAAVEGV